MNDFHWTCPCCRNMFPSLDNISRSLNDMQNKNEERMSKLEKRMGNFEDFTKGEVKNTLLGKKTEILEELKLGVNEMVDKRSNELDDRKRRELNLTLFNLPESKSPSGLDKKKEDEENMRKITHSLGLENIEITNLYRLRKPLPDKCRPLKVILGNKAHRNSCWTIVDTYHLKQNFSNG